ncbi:putative dehydrogenase [Sphingobacterium allocomposti]|uniref:Putative dehydrogenase n=1 Tax=Sphingobacterium allocomposti TaxID=415956 RepID=A0A5S5DFL2_9SPHI|nr:Gfo/Idh/MocA family oxidoreductase [Sphingobacterium composti Yoo et al. 2007 non Ten et al. 2007]TYP94138.1 putative dehydrogenase [Sphingobacterium composti Yoo et al. 2007 non Ten et al. 2007]
MNRSRREFLQKLTMSSMVLPIVSTYTPQWYGPLHTDVQGPVLRVALMGLGGYAQRVADAMKDCKRAKVTGLVSGTPAKLKEWGSKYNVPERNRYSYETFDDIKNNPDIDAVYVITPNALHHDNVIRAARAGKHVICEKPMAVSVQEGQEMVDACAAAGVQLLIGYRMRFEPNTLEIVNRRNAGEFGKINFFQGQCGFKIGDPNQWRLNKELAGGGALFDIGIYAINGTRYMVGEEPVWVTAQETKTDPTKFKEGVDETIQFQLGFASGAVASCLSTYNMNYLDRFYLNGDKGFAELWPSTGYGPIKGRTHQQPLNHPHIAHQTIQMDEMAAIILDGKKPVLPVDGTTGLQDLKIIEAIYRACATGARQELKLV